MHYQNTIFVTPKLLAQQSDALASLTKLAQQCNVALAYPNDARDEARLLCKAHPFLSSCLQATEQVLFEIVADKTGTFLLDEGIKLSFYCPLELATSSVITLFFHTLSDAIAYIQAFPRPGEQLPKLIDAYAALLAQGKLVAFPTETVYGLGADALNEEAVRSIFTAKQRPFFDPLIVHIAGLDQLEGLVVDLDPRAKLLMDRFWPGPLTLILKKHPSVPAIVTANSQTVAIRMPSNPLALNLIKASGKAIAAPSANRFGYTSPTTALHVKEQLGERIDAILDGGACTVGIESTVLSLCTEVPTILRPGKIGLKELEPLLGEVEVSKQVGPTDTNLESPGLLESHYAPTTPLYLVDDVTLYKDQSDVGVLLFEKQRVPFKGPVVYVSEKEDAEEAASRLYWAIRHLDSLNLRCMVGSLLPEEGIGVAINNRLRKASAKH